MKRSGLIEDVYLEMGRGEERLLIMSFALGKIESNLHNHL